MVTQKLPHFRIEIFYLQSIINYYFNIAHIFITIITHILSILQILVRSFDVYKYPIKKILLTDMMLLMLLQTGGM